MYPDQPNAPHTDPDRDDEIEFRQRFGGAVIDEDGHETPITEDMVQAACRALEQESFIGLHGRNPMH